MDSIVINTYNRPELLSRCLDNLSRQARLDEAEVIVVDDGSRGDFHAIERLWRRKMNLKFVPIKHAGAPAARNRGVAAASGERVIFLGDDVFVRPGWLARHLDQGRGNPLIAIIGPYPLENHPDYSASFLKWAESFHLSRIKDPTNAGFALFGTGNASMDRAKFLEIGGFDERFIYYGWEDLDLAYRFEKGGGRIIFDAEAKAIHNHPYLKRSDLWQRELKSGMNAYLFWDKWRNGDVEYMKFWSGEPKAGPAWRRTLGAWTIDFLERRVPNSPLLPRLYERMVYSCRMAGAAQAAAILRDAAPRPARGDPSMANAG